MLALFHLNGGLFEPQSQVTPQTGPSDVHPLLRCGIGTWAKAHEVLALFHLNGGLFEPQSQVTPQTGPSDVHPTRLRPPTARIIVAHGGLSVLCLGPRISLASGGIYAHQR